MEPSFVVVKSVAEKIKAIKAKIKRRKKKIYIQLTLKRNEMKNI